MANTSLTGMAILLVEDDPLLRKRITARLEALGATVAATQAVQPARELLKQQTFDFAFLDVNLPDGKGTDLLNEGAFPPATSVIIVTAHGGVAGAVEAMRLGAVDYLVKPFDLSQLGVAIDRAQAAHRATRLEEHDRDDSDEIFFGDSLAQLRSQLQKILEADQRIQTQLPPVLIEGETGTGKTTFARWLHQQGPRAHHPLVEVNCSALPETLAESELFGHERGAFTDAKSTRLGLFEAGARGTLFLDELPSLSLPLQAKVLTAIEDRTIRRVGSTKPVTVDVRIVAATNQPLKELIAAGRFREDLYHRLDLYRLHIPPLRERGDDIIKLAGQLTRRLCQRHRLPVKSFTSIGTRRLLNYHWPGNIRELEHELERALVFEDASELSFPPAGSRNAGNDGHR